VRIDLTAGEEGGERWQRSWERHILRDLQ
jgi:hypothetical protein